jgi:hypothetical protein
VRPHTWTFQRLHTRTYHASDGRLDTSGRYTQNTYTAQHAAAKGQTRWTHCVWCTHGNRRGGPLRVLPRQPVPQVHHLLPLGVVGAHRQGQGRVCVPARVRNEPRKQNGARCGGCWQVKACTFRVPASIECGLHAGRVSPGPGHNDTDVCGRSAEASPALPWLRAGVQVQRSPLSTQLNQRHLRVWGASQPPKGS